MKKQIKSKGKPTTLERLHQLETPAAGIDIGANEIWVAVPPERVEQPIRRFGAFTVELKAIVAWLQQCQIRTVAMESTGLYWIALYQLLADAGLKVCLVNARHVKNVPGRKSDERDCQWLQYLHSVGLLRASYSPQQAVCAVRSIYRYRQNLITLCAQHVQHMQGALDQINVKLHHVIDDLTGVTGLAIVEAILAGQRDPLQASQVSASSHSRYPTEHRQSLGGRLAQRTALCVANRLAELEACSRADPKVRPTITPIQPALGRLHQGYSGRQNYPTGPPKAGWRAEPPNSSPAQASLQE
jgi:transposase